MNGSGGDLDEGPGCRNVAERKGHGVPPLEHKTQKKAIFGPAGPKFFQECHLLASESLGQKSNLRSGPHSGAA